MRRFWRFCQRSFNPHTLQGKMFIICMVISSGIVIIAAQIITRSAVTTITENAYNNIFENILYADSNLNSFLEDAVAISMAISSNRSIVLKGLEDNSPVASYSAFEIQKEVEAYLLNIKINKEHIRMAAVIGIDGKSFKSEGTLILRRTVHEPWFIEAIQSPGIRIFFNTPDFNQIIVCRPIILGRQVAGLTIVEMNYQVLNSVYSSTPLTQSQITAFDDTGNIVFANYDLAGIRNVNQSSFGFTVNSHYLAHSVEGMPVRNGSAPARRYLNVNGERVLLVSYESSYSKLTTVALLSYASLISAARHINFLTLVIVAVSVAAAALASWLFSRVFCRNIYLLQDSMIRIQDGNMEVRSKINSQDEIGIMSNIFNSMMDRIELLLENIKETENQKRRAEQTVLEAQIQPHFLYNTINSIAYVAHQQKEKELETVANATVQLLRGVLGVRESFIPLSQEYDYIEQYMVIQRFKMGREFNLDWDVEEGLWSYLIPKLILQPIVENALLHGISQKKNGRISVQVFRRKETLVMKVTDNGQGMNLEDIDAWSANSSEVKSGFRKVGISNVRERITLIYGEPYGVNINSVKDAFTTVELILPIQEVNS